jgi:hypothetical protein
LAYVVLGMMNQRNILVRRSFSILAGKLRLLSCIGGSGQSARPDFYFARSYRNPPERRWPESE